MSEHKSTVSTVKIQSKLNSFHRQLSSTVLENNYIIERPIIVTKPVAPNSIEAWMAMDNLKINF